MSLQQYEKVCKEQFKIINLKLDDIHNRLFVDNGSVSFQTKVNRNTKLITVAVWVISIICAASIAQATKNIVNHFEVRHVEKLESVVDINQI